MQNILRHPVFINGELHVFFDDQSCLIKRKSGIITGTGAAASPIAVAEASPIAVAEIKFFITEYFKYKEVDIQNIFLDNGFEVHRSQIQIYKIMRHTSPPNVIYDGHSINDLLI